MTRDKVGIPASPFHEGELELQRHIGAVERMDKVGRRVVRDHMPDQHRDFFTQLPFILIGAVDSADDVWASLATGDPGFVASPDPKTLHISGARDEADPADAGMEDGASLGLLGIELHTRRRNRMNGQLVRKGPEGFMLKIEHSFGNCPKYIQTRDFRFAQDIASPPPSVSELDRLDRRAHEMILSADTFFVASYVDLEGSVRQVDVSHRGGKPGFVRIDGNDCLTIPDFAGNHHFNTLGNILRNGKAGLLFIDFETGDLLQLTGEARVILEGPQIGAFQGSERLWTFSPRRIVYRTAATSLRWGGREDGLSPFSRMTGSWAEADARLEAAEFADQWRPFRIDRVVEESRSVRSFHLAPADARAAPMHKAGQHLRLRLPSKTDPGTDILTYTISTAPSDLHLRISVKRQGPTSQAVHTLRPGDIVEIRGPSGLFTIDAAERRPTVFLAGGIGVTPLLAMARHLLFEGRRIERLREAWFFYAAHDTQDRAFNDELTGLAADAGGAFRLIRLLSSTEGAKEGHDYEIEGRLDVELLKRTLPFNDYDFYLCGPARFMRDLHAGLRGLNVSEMRIHAEAFGPASLLKRQGGTMQSPASGGVAVSFQRSNIEAIWQPGVGTLLDLAESAGVFPDTSCRAGACGTCLTNLLSGEVTHLEPPGAEIYAGQILLCRAVPADSHPDGAQLVLNV